MTPWDGTRLRRPAIRSVRRAAFPATVERAMAAAFGRLPMGAARDLLVQLVGAVEPLYRTLGRQSARRRRDVHELVTAACRVAEDLAALDHGVAASHDGARDEMVAKLQETIAAVQRLSAAPVADAAAAAELARLLTVLRGRAGPHV